ncbi:MAG: penicillin-binding protein 1C [Bacteroidota bacterium]
MLIGASPLLILYAFCLPRTLFKVPYSVVLEDAQGQLLAAQIAEDGQWRFPVNDSLPTKFVQALLTFEDQRFYRHPGVDFRALGRAILQNIRNGRVVSGGSTISMQVIRLAKGQRRRSVLHKAQEIMLATRLELAYSKKEILHFYAAHAPFGGNVVGLDAAAWRYFGKSAHLLSWSEAASLAVLPNSPALIHPGRNRSQLIAKRDRLLDRLLAQGHIDSLDLELAKAETIPDEPLPLPQVTPHLLQRASSDYQNGLLKNSRVKTSIDYNLQLAVNQQVRLHHERLRQNEIHNAAAIVIHVPSNQIAAYTGNAPGAGNAHGEMVDVIRAPRSTGSILKPFLYALALEEGTILPHSLLLDVPVNYNGYRPQNYNRDYQGATPASEALARSLNIPFVHLLKEYGLEKFHLAMQQLGMSTLTNSPDHYGLTLILGGAEGKLEEITGMYAQMGRLNQTFTNNNSRYPGEAYQAPVYHQGAKKKKSALQKEPLNYGAAAAWWTLQAMQEVKRPGSEGEWQVFKSSKSIAWKTGTSFGFRDAWAVGLNPEYAVGVWVGNADGEGRPGLVGVQAAAPLLFDLFRLLPGDPSFSVPYDDFQPVQVCRESGNLASPFCPVDTIDAPAIQNDRVTCTYHRRIHLDPSKAWQVHGDCWSPFDMQTESWFVLPPLQAHYYRRYHPEYRSLPPFYPACLDAESPAAMELIYPREPTRILVPVDLNGVLSRTVFEVAHSDEQARLYWHIDETFLGVTEQFHTMEFNPQAGRHRLTVVDDVGKRLELDFEIIGQ